MTESPAVAAYLELLKTCLSGTLHDETLRSFAPQAGLKRTIARAMQATVKPLGLELAKRVPTDPARRSEGRDWPAHAETMIGRKRLDNLQFCVGSVLHEDVPGDLIECGVWRGGATIFMRGILQGLRRQNAECMGRRFIRGPAAAGRVEVPRRRRGHPSYLFATGY